MYLSPRLSMVKLINSRNHWFHKICTNCITKWRLLIMSFGVGLIFYFFHIQIHLVQQVVSLETNEIIKKLKQLAAIMGPKLPGKTDILDSSINNNNEEKPLCIMPKLTPGGKDIYKLDRLQLSRTFGIPPACDKTDHTMFAMDFESNLIRLKLKDPFWKAAKCFYRKIQRVKDKPDFTYRKGKTVYNITQNSTKIPPDMELISVWCLKEAGLREIYRDYFSQVSIKPELEKLLEDRPASVTPENYPSILIIGQDSSSHMNFRRHMPKAHDYLVNSMKAVEFHGFNSLGAGTLWSIFPLLSGLDLLQVNKVCHQSERKSFDSCPWIWKDLEKLGYRTSYSEDAIHVGIFNGDPLTGFSKQPVHYDFRSLSDRLNSVGKAFGYPNQQRVAGCFGSRLTMDVILENSVRLAHTFAKNNKPFFHFSWTSELTHNLNYYSKFGEATVVKSLKQLHENQLLNNTVLILLSDHGMRYGELRRRTRQGFLEERLPILYIYLPEALKNKYPTAYKNMKGNTDKLTTAFDVYEMMMDLIKQTDLQEDRLIERKNEAGVDKRRNISLFLPISPHRTCDLIGFSSIYCACLNRTSLPVNTSLAQGTAAKVVASINAKLFNDSDFKCAPLELVRITSMEHLKADVSLNDENARFGKIRIVRKVPGKMFEIGFETRPGKGMFYASVMKNEKDSQLTVTDVNRVSNYGKDADCMQRKELKPFCYCNE